jgi:hypothetical protein
MRINLSNVCVGMLILLAVTCWAQASPIDMHRAVSGANRPFTTLKDNLPTEWKIWLEPRITGPTATSWNFHFPERSFGNIFGDTQSQLLALGTRRRMVEGQSTGIWLIWDMLAWVPVAHVLYLDTQDGIGPWVNPWFNEEARKSAFGGLFIPETGGVPEPGNIRLVPEPTSGALILMGSLLLMSRSTRRRFARV